MPINTIIPSVDYIVLAPCNMKCKYCFATFNDVGSKFIIKNALAKEESLKLIDSLAEAGFKKITFLGGEPTLCPWLLDLVKRAKEKGLFTSITTNASLLTEKYLDNLRGVIDWITVSIDSLDQEKLSKIGRVVANKAISESQYRQTLQNIKARGIKLKINTVISSVNWQDDITDFILEIKPNIWKLLQVLPMSGQNDALIANYLISEDKFGEYVKKAKKVEKVGVKVKIVDNLIMPGSYALIDPMGRFIDTFNQRYAYSDPILKIGVKNALKQVRIDEDRFFKRGGLYEW